MGDITQSRSYKVVKHNDLIQKARYNLSLNQQKLLAYVISLIKPTDTDLKRYEISIKDYCSLVGIEKKYFYKEMIDLVDDLDNKAFWIETEEKIFKFRWFSEVEYVKGKAKLRILLNSNLKEYLIQLKEKYTSYYIYNLLALRSKYSIRIYELCLSFFTYKKQKILEKTFDLEELKKMLLAEHYTEFKDFRKRVLDKPIVEINEFTDINISYEKIKDGKNIVAIRFIVEKKQFPNNHQAYLKTIEEINKRNRQIKGQLSLFDLEEKNFK